MNAGTLRLARGVGLTAVVALTAGLALAPAAAPPPPRRAVVSGVQDLVFLGEARPVLIRVHAYVDGKPVQEAWEGFQKYLFSYLDVDGDGVLSQAEAERAPSVDQIRAGGLFGGFGGRGGGSGPPASADLDADKDGKVTLAELSAYYHKKGFVPFQVQANLGSAGAAGAMAFFGGGAAEPSVDAVSKAIFAVLDADKDGRLTKKELAGAPAALLKLDDDEDETVSAGELVPNVRPSADLFSGMMGRPGRGGAGGNKMVIPLSAPGEAPAELVRALQQRYGPKASEEKKLSRKDLGLDEATFRALDADGDGALDGAELAGFARRAPDLELVARLGAEVQLTAAKGRPSPLAGRAKMAGGGVLLDLGKTRVELRGGAGDPSGDGLAGLVRQQYAAQFKQADKDNDGSLDAKEAKASRQFGTLFKAMDRDGDGKVSEKEMVAYLDQYDRIRARATACCVSLVLSDQSRGLFDLLDGDRDGRLSVREMRGAAGLLEHLGAAGRGHLAKADLPRSYRLTLRRGQEGALGGQEAAFLRLYSSGGGYKAKAETAGPVWFRKMDRNGDGEVSPKEFLWADDDFKKIDADGDGLISLKEAAAFDKKLRESKKQD